MEAAQASALPGVAQRVYSDVERLVGQHLGRLAGQVKEEFGKAATAGVSFGSGAGMMALGTVLGGIGVVHLMHKATGLPLWMCYGLCSATACAAGAGLFAAGAKAASELDLIPEGPGRRSGRQSVPDSIHRARGDRTPNDRRRIGASGVARARQSTNVQPGPERSLHALTEAQGISTKLRTYAGLMPSHPSDRARLGLRFGV